MMWQQVLNLPLETRVRLATWPKDTFIYRARDRYGMIFWKNEVNCYYERDPEFWICLMYQDTWEIYTVPGDANVSDS